jgi:hypothetical protein
MVLCNLLLTIIKVTKQNKTTTYQRNQQGEMNKHKQTNKEETKQTNKHTHKTLQVQEQ